MRNHFKQWSLSFLAWRVDVKLARLKDDDRILYLANLLMDEVEKQGYDTEFHDGTTNAMRSLSVSHYTWRSTDNLRVGYINNHWEVRGNRTGTTPAKEVAP